MHPDVPPPHQERCLQAVGAFPWLLPHPPRPNVLSFSAQVPGLPPSGQAEAGCRSGEQIPDHRCPVIHGLASRDRRSVGDHSAQTRPRAGCTRRPKSSPRPEEQARKGTRATFSLLTRIHRDSAVEPRTNNLVWDGPKGAVSNDKV